MTNVEVFYWNEDDIADAKHHGGAELALGWYWWHCIHGMPCSDPMGPFATEAEAIANSEIKGP